MIQNDSENAKIFCYELLLMKFSALLKNQLTQSLIYFTTYINLNEILEFFFFFSDLLSNPEYAKINSYKQIFMNPSENL